MRKVLLRTFSIIGFAFMLTAMILGIYHRTGDALGIGLVGSALIGIGMGFRSDEERGRRS